MKRIKISEVQGPVLDWLVGVALGRTDITFDDFDELGMGCVQAEPDPFMNYSRCWAPSRYWQQGGPILDREKITLSSLFWEKDGWKAWKWKDHDAAFDHFGPTMLIAGLRCFLASRLGEYAEVPEELL
jgi:hypothetical protein